jgi:hypothetical protein
MEPANPMTTECTEKMRGPLRGLWAFSLCPLGEIPYLPPSLLEIRE